MIELSIADLVFNQVLCVHPAKLEMVLSVLSRRLGISQVEGLAIDPSMAWQPGQHGMVAARGPAAQPEQRWQDVGHGVAVLPVSGSLVARTRGLDAMSGLTSYRQLDNDFQALMADDSVQHIVLQVDSPGGAVATLPDLVDRVAAARGVKPVTALVDDSAYSAGYWLASAASEVVISRTSGVGSIGALMVHVDRSRANEMAGLKVTAIASGTKKTQMSSDRPLSEADLEEAQALVDQAGRMFAEDVARLRGLSVDAVLAMQAGTYNGVAAIDAGLADRVMAAPDALREIVQRYAKPARPLPSGGAGRVSRAARAMAMTINTTQT